MPNTNSGKLQKLCIQASKILGTRNLPSLVSNFSLLPHAVFSRAAIWICFIVAAFLRKSNSLPFSFLFVHHLAECLSPTNNFSLSYPDFREIFSHFHHQGTLFFIPMKTTLHLASSSRCNFGTRSL